MVDVAYDDVLDKALQLPAAEKARLLERLAMELREVLGDQLATTIPVDDSLDLTSEQFDRLLHQRPKTGAEIAASGLFGAWKDLGISDGAEWVNEQKHKRMERNKWSLD
jgi:hypothetical protein